ncbi:MAG: hypothetical protein RR383_01130 [Muribaculaceae bacterium]
MKKIILAFALIISSVLSFNAVATDNVTKCPAKCPTKQECKKTVCDKKCDVCPLFDGLKLTDAQKKEIKALKASLNCNCCEKGKCNATTQEALNSGLKKILTADQYAQFIAKKDNIQKDCKKRTKCPKANKKCNK